MKETEESGFSKIQKKDEEKREKNEWVKEFHNLKRNYLMMNRKKYQPFFSLKSEFKSTLEGFTKYEEKLEKKEKDEELSLFTNISQIKQNLKEVHQMVKRINPQENYLRLLQSKIQSIETNLSQFKSKSRKTFEDLALEESTLLKELEIYNDKFNTYTKESTVPTKPKRKIEATSKIKQFLTETASKSEDSPDELTSIKHTLQEIDKKIEENGGSNCGWDAADHSDFLKLRTRHKNKTNTIAFISELKKLVPMISESEIGDHIHRYEIYQELLQSKKHNITKYNTLKKELRATHHVFTTIPQNTLNEDLDLLGVSEGKKMQKSKAECRKEAEERMRKKKEIEEWKNKKMQERQNKQKDIDEFVNTEKKKAHQKLDNMVKKQCLVDYHERKAIGELRKREEEDKKKSEMKRRLTAADKDRLKEREIKNFQKKMELMGNKYERGQLKEEAEDRMKQKMNRNFMYVESRLGNQTTAQISKKRDKFQGTQGKDASTFGGDLLHAQVRSVPSWRQGLA